VTSWIKGALEWLAIILIPNKILKASSESYLIQKSTVTELGISPLLCRAAETLFNVRFLPNHSQFNTHSSANHSTLYFWIYWEHHKINHNNAGGEYFDPMSNYFFQQLWLENYDYVKMMMMMMMVMVVVIMM